MRNVRLALDNLSFGLQNVTHSDKSIIKQQFQYKETAKTSDIMQNNELMKKNLSHIIASSIHLRSNSNFKIVFNSI